MDDYPAGPTSPGLRRPPLSIVIPVRDGGRDFERCLRALQQSNCLNFELIVVDDGSRDDSSAKAAEAGATVLRHDRPLGPAAARNLGAKAAIAPIVFFLDADVEAHPNTVGRVLDRFDAAPDLAAVFGSYDARPAAPGLVSRFRNLLHHHTHQRGEFTNNARVAHTFWTGCGAIRRDVFLGLGGFDPLLYRRPAIEDIELGYRLTRAGHRIELARDLLVTHLKRWTLREMIRTDVLRRGVPWTLLLLRSGVAETDLNVSPGQRACVAATGAAFLGIMLAAVLASPAWLGLTVAGLTVVVALNAHFYSFLAAQLGPSRALACLPLHAVYYACCGASVALAIAMWFSSARARGGARWPAGTRADAASTAPLPRVDVHDRKVNR